MKHPITDRYIEVIERFGELRGEIQNFNVMSMGEVDDRVSHVFTTLIFLKCGLEQGT